MVDVAIPLELVVSVSVTVEFRNVPLAPVEGAVNVTINPLSGVPPWVTVTINGDGNGALIPVDWPLPLVATTVVAGGGLPLELPEHAISDASMPSATTVS